MEVIADSQIAERYGAHFISMHLSGMYILKGSAAFFLITRQSDKTIIYYKGILKFR